MKPAPGILRYKGKLIKRSVFEKRQQAISLGKSRKREREKDEESEILTGRRIVNLQTLAKNLFCRKYQTTLSLKNTVGENRRGLLSSLSVKCENCLQVVLVHTGEFHNDTDEDIRKISDVNSCAVLG